MEAAENIDSFTALIWSAHNGHDSCLRQLLSAKVHSCAMTARVSTVRTRLSFAECGLSQACVCVCRAQARYRETCGRVVGLTVCVMSKCAGQRASGHQQWLHGLDMLGAKGPRRLPPRAPCCQGALVRNANDSMSEHHAHSALTVSHVAMRRPTWRQLTRTA